MQLTRDKLKATPNYVFRRVYFKLRPLQKEMASLFPRLVKMPTSQTDRPDYNNFCRRAARDEKIFEKFKDLPAYRVVLEHLSCEQGEAYLEYIRDHYSDLELAKFLLNDKLGNPRKCQYGELNMSATTLRYVKILGDLKKYFGDLSSMNIVEIGSAYGGQATVIAQEFAWENYVAVDLPAALALAKKYLKKLGVKNIEFKKQSELTDLDYDLVISNYAWSECSPETRNYYLHKVLARAKKGYMICNCGDEKQVEESLNQFHEIDIFPETPQTGSKSKNYMVVWGHR